MGIVTLEDVIEEIVGDIWDEKDEVEEDYTETASGVYTIDGTMLISELFDLLELDYRKINSEYTTVGGWTMEMLEKFPTIGEQFVYENIRATVTAMDGKRVESVLIEIQDTDQNEQSEKE